MHKALLTSPIQAQTHLHKHALRHTYTHSDTHTHTNTHALRHTYAHNHKHTHTHTHTHTYIHTRAHTCFWEHFTVQVERLTPLHTLSQRGLPEPIWPPSLPSRSFLCLFLWPTA